MVQHRGLLVAWLLVVGTFFVGLLGGVVELIILPQLGAMGLAVITVRRTDHRAGLRYQLLYRVSLGLLLAASATCLVAAGSTAFIDHVNGTMHVAGFLALATTNLLLTVLAWRALVTPTPRRAAIAGLLAVIVETVAMLVDILMNIRTTLHGGSAIGVTLFSSFVATWAGALACMAALGTFERGGATVMPEARVVDET